MATGEMRADVAPAVTVIGALGEVAPCAALPAFSWQILLASSRTSASVFSVVNSWKNSAAGAGAPTSLTLRLRHLCIHSTLQNKEARAVAMRQKKCWPRRGFGGRT